ncbi:MAG: hypothetical protein M3220_10040 [Chloroflexota bacterium]|nr:hypothetical protein [Chloroflexota bacterium]
MTDRRDDIVDREEPEERRDEEPEVTRERVDEEQGVPTEQEWREERGLGVDPGDQLADL